MTTENSITCLLILSTLKIKSAIKDLIFDISNNRFQMNLRILKISPVFDDAKVFSKGNVVFGEPSILRSQSYFKWRYGLWWFKGTDDPQVYKWQKVISDGSHDFDTPIFDGLVQINAAHVTDACLVLAAIDHMEISDWQKGEKCPDHKTNT